MRLLTLSTLFLFAFSANAQKGTKKIKNSNNRAKVKEIFRVSSADMTTKMGEYKYYYLGRKQIVGTYINNLREGEWVFTPSGTFKITGNYKNDQRTGAWTYEKEEKVIARCNFENNKRYGKQTSYHSNGQLSVELNYVNGSKHGVCKWYYPNGQLKEIVTFQDGKMNGLYESYWKDGTKICTIEYTNAVPVNLKVDSRGHYPFYYEGNLTNGNGNIRLISYNSENQKLTTIVDRNYKDSLLHGSIKYESSNGKSTYDGHFEKGFMVGDWKFNDVNRDIKETRTYTLDQKIENDSSIYYATFFNRRFYTDDSMPIYGPTGSDGDLLSFVANKVEYPVEAKENGVTGVVYVSYIVAIDGYVRDVKVVRGADPLLDTEAMRVIEDLPHYQPGLQAGMPVPVQYTIPIRYVLN